MLGLGKINRRITDLDSKVAIEPIDSFYSTATFFITEPPSFLRWLDLTPRGPIGSLNTELPSEKLEVPYTEAKYITLKLSTLKLKV